MATQFDYSGLNKMDLSSALDFSHISKDVQNHLVRVYGMLATMLGACATGCWAAIAFGVNLGMLPLFVSVFLIFWLAWDVKKETSKRVAALVVFGFCNGLSVAPLVKVAAEVDPSILVTAFVATSVIFVCFSVAAIVSAGNRTYLFLGGALSSFLSFMLWMNIASFFFTSMRPLAWRLEVYGGLLMFLAYILYDTQVMVVKAQAGDRDFCWHSIGLFLDFLNVFVRIVIILMKNQQNGKKKRGNARSR